MLAIKPETDKDKFRDRIATADERGKRIWVYPAKPKGRLYTARTMVSVGLVAFLFVGPLIKFDGNPILLFDILSRRFIIFGLTLWPQDFYLVVLAVITTGVFIILFTAVFGRLFCGWICPQTVFLEMIFRRIEYWIEGGPARQRNLAERGWDGEKLYKRLIKHSVFFALSFIIGNIFLAYIIGIDQLLVIVTDPPRQHLVGLTAMLVFSFLFYGVFSWFREQACTLVCPYGRLQGVLIDANSIVVAYDYKRGEPRQPIRRGEDRTNVGDCVECNACVNVCPTGIDIRNGTQLECVNCTACIDACNRTMRKTSLPEGLIRYTSENILKGLKRMQLTGRIFIYSIVLVILLSLTTYLLAGRTDVETTILRTPGALYTETETGDIRNLYSVKLINKTFNEIPIQFRFKSPSPGVITLIGVENIIPPEGVAESAFFVTLPRSILYTPSTMVVIEVISGDRVIEEITTSFMGPRKISNDE